MDVKTLVDISRPADGPLALYCGKCGSVYPLRGGMEMPLLEGRAEACCKPVLCRGCGTDAGGMLVCHDCHERERYERAEKVPWRVYDGAVCFGDDYYNSIDDLAERCEDDGIPLPPYVWATTPGEWDGLDVDRAIENELEDTFEDAFDWVKDLDELRAFVAAWNAKQNVTWHNHDPKRVVLLEGYSVAVGSPA